jgi:ParB family transcriptional regulator, chromosome partitioning protein
MTTTDFLVPLNRLIFGQEDGEGINARTTGRLEGIPELAANIHANGQIENLIVKRAGDDPGTPLPPDWTGVRDLFSVSNGNRRLAAFRMIYGETSVQPVRCTAHDVGEDKAFEFSLTTAVTAAQLHPVDQYEAFARLRDRHGKTIEEIALQYGLTEHEVNQALALGHLSPKVREAWRKGDIKASAAKAFTLAPDHAAQDKVLDELSGDGDLGGIDDYEIKDALKIGNDESGVLVEFVGIDAYVARGGKVQRDFFGTDHRVSDPKLAKKMAAEKLDAECGRLKEAGWSFAVTTDSVRNTRYNYGRVKVEPAPTEEERQRLAELNAVFHRGSHHRAGVYHTETFAQLTAPEQKAYLAYHELERVIEQRAYTPKMMKKAGCFVGIDDDGFLKIEFGFVKPAQKEQAAKVAREEKKEQTKAAAKAAKAEGKAPPAPAMLSNALKQRLEMWLVAATRDAIAGEPQLVNSPLFEILAKIACAQIVTERAWGTPDAIRTKFPSIRQVLNPGVFNAALAKRFDVEDYFSNAPRGLVIKAIAEAINPDEARKASTGKTKAEIWRFALANLGKTGWLPKELRTVHYKGPGSEGYKRPAASHQAAPAAKATADNADAKPKASPANMNVLTMPQHRAKHDRAGRVGATQLKRTAAAAKKPAKKTAAKR